MRQNEMYSGGTRGQNGASTAQAMEEEVSLGELFKRLSSHTGDLVRQEIALAKSEMGQVGTNAGKSATSIGISLVLAICGALSLTAFLIIWLGNLTGGRYAMWALIIGAVALAIAGLMAKSAVNRLKTGIKPQQTIESMRENTAWAGRQVEELKHDVTTDPQLTPSRG